LRHADSCQPCGQAASCLWLVYLTWTTRLFQQAYLDLAEETAALKLASRSKPISTHLRSSSYAKRSNSVVCYFKIALKVTVSLFTMSIQCHPKDDH
jgi:hypothetical protein